MTWDLIKPSVYNIERDTVPFKIKGTEIPVSYKLKKHRKKGFEQVVVTVPGEPYGREEPTVFFYSTRNGEHLTCLNKGGLRRRSVDYLGREMCGIEPDRIINQNSFIVVLKNTFPDKNNS